MNKGIYDFFLSVNKKIIVGFISCIFLFTIGCKKEINSKINFKSDFTKKEISAIPKLEYWSNNFKEWQLADNRIECLVSNKNRKIHLITRQLRDIDGYLEMKIRVGFFNDKISTLNRNWAGFHLGSDKNFLNNKKGIDIGICTNGALFIGTPSPNHNNHNIIKSLKNGVDLKILIHKNQQNYTVDFSVLNIEDGQILSRISKRNITKEQIIGDLVLKSNFEIADEEVLENKKSVWFQDWEIKGSKVIALAEQNKHY